MRVNYKIYNPAGNITALVIGDNYTSEERKLINDQIMKKDSRIEQVGFVSINEKKLTMAGGEFCGNATRSAILYYKMRENEKLEINNQQIKGGIIGNNVWCELSIENYKFSIIDEKIYKIELEGITIIVINEEVSNEYLKKDIKVEAQKIIDKYNIRNNDAVGVMFLEKNDKLKIYPVVWVKKVNTLFLENACGSGTIGASILKTILEPQNSKYAIKQPSGEVLETEIKKENGKIAKAILKGKIEEDDEIKEIIL